MQQSLAEIDELLESLMSVNSQDRRKPSTQQGEGLDELSRRKAKTNDRLNKMDPNGASNSHAEQTSKTDQDQSSPPARKISNPKPNLDTKIATVEKSLSSEQLPTVDKSTNVDKPSSVDNTSIVDNSAPTELPAAVPNLNLASKLPGDSDESSKKSVTPPMTPTSSTIEPEWREYVSRTTGKIYYQNTISKKTQWDRPQGLIEPYIEGSSRNPSFTLISPRVDSSTNNYLMSPSTSSNGSVSPRVFLNPSTSQDLMQSPRTIAVNADPQRSAIPSKTLSKDHLAITIQVELVDGSTSKKLQVSLDFTVLDVLQAFASKTDLWQYQFFQLAVINNDGTGT